MNREQFSQFGANFEFLAKISAELSRLFRILKNVKMRYKKRHHKKQVKSLNYKVDTIKKNHRFWKLFHFLIFKFFVLFLRDFPPPFKKN